MKILYPFQVAAIEALLENPKKHFVVCRVGAGKGALAIAWAYRTALATHRNSVLVVTTASKTKVSDDKGRNDFEQDADEFVGTRFHQAIPNFETVSWDLLYKWVNTHASSLNNWIYIFDEVAKGKSPTSRRGKAFQKIAKTADYWTGYTATPGDGFIDYANYYISCGLIKNVTEFKHLFCEIQTYKGFPEIVGYRNTHTLEKWWANISYAPDTREMEAQLPKSVYQRVPFKKPSGYDQVIKLRQKILADGTFEPDPSYKDIIQTPSALSHYLRRLCFTKEKQAWLADFLEASQEGVIIFYNYIDSGDLIEQIIHKVRPESRIWRIDGSHHEIPTASTFSSNDVVLAQWQSGSEGLNLQFLRYMVMVEPTYVYSTLKQAQGRISRIGQSRTMYYYTLYSKGTIDEAILRTLSEKQDFSVKTWLLGNKLMSEGEKLI